MNTEQEKNISQKKVRSFSKKKGKLFILSGPSGVGKTTICKSICSAIPNLIWSVSLTTRPPRINEIEGVDYYFVSEKDFLEKIEKGEFLEYAKVHGYYYGTLKKPIDEALEKGINCLLEIDVQGGRKLKEKKEYDKTFILLVPPNIETLHERLVKRKKDTHAVIKKRVKNAYNELSQAYFYDYKVMNVNLEKTIEEVKKIIEENINKVKV